MGEDEDDTIPVTTEASLDSEAQNIFKIFKSHIWGNDVRAAVFTAELLCRDSKLTHSLSLCCQIILF